MSDGPRQRRAILIGATGLVGSEVIRLSGGAPNLKLTGLARREAQLPRGAQLELLIAEPERWSAIIARMKPDVLLCALGTTWAKSGKSEAAFRAVDHDLVLECGHAAAEAGARQMILVSSIGADAHAKSFYVRVKGEVEDKLKKLLFARLDILRPGLLRGERGDDSRKAEGIALALAPLVDPLLRGRFRKYRSIAAREVARAMIALTEAKADGRYVHDNQAMRSAMLRLAAQKAAAIRREYLTD